MKRENIPFKDLEKNNFLRFVFSSQLQSILYTKTFIIFTYLWP